jgi:hypothetical protein
MTTKAEWLALAERCEKAKGPDQSIDVWIENYCGIAEFIQPHTWRASIDSPERGRIRPLTASLDAITALIERELPEVRWVCRTDTLGGRSFGNLYRRRNPDRSWPCFAFTPALALCAAFCRAMAEKEPT